LNGYIPYHVIADGAPGHCSGGVDLCVVGCDRVARNGGTAKDRCLALSLRTASIPWQPSLMTAIPSGDAIQIEAPGPRKSPHQERITPIEPHY
jgi:methylthioribose-1-phosphate isomerase